MGDRETNQGQNQTGGQNKGSTQVGTHGNQETPTSQGAWNDRSEDESYRRDETYGQGQGQGQNQGQPNPQSQGNMGNTTKEPMSEQQTGANTRPTNQKR